MEETLKILEIYKKFAEEFLAIPVISGLKSEKEKFAGAVRTYCIEALMPDGKALQAGTSHFVGQNFAKAFNIRFENKNQELEYGGQTSWGVSTRLIGALIMLHGDDSGLIIPPKVAPLQAVIIPISRGNWKETVLPKAQEIFKNLKNKEFRVKLDDSDSNTPGWKFSEWEMRGVPVRIEIGPKDIEKNQVVLVNRINREKTFVSIDELNEKLAELLEKIQDTLFERAKKFREENTSEANNFEELSNIIDTQRGLIKTGWCGSAECEERVKEKNATTIRAILENEQGKYDKCVVCGKEAKHTVLFAKSY
jgi:prolyl-tRNA synthetase